MENNPLPRLDANPKVREELLSQCRLKLGEVWEDPLGRHRVACADAGCDEHIGRLVSGVEPTLAIHDPPYNLAAFQRRGPDEFVKWSRRWIELTIRSLAPNASLYVWLGADQKEHFQPLPEFMIMMREFRELSSRSFITMRNQRGYGTQKNWMAARQELLYYTKGSPEFEVQYTDIPKILRGYYKEIGGERTENLSRSRSENIRPGNVWVDIQQVFYRMEENVSGCYAQKPLKAIERIVQASSKANDAVVDFFAHSGTTLLACEKLGRKCMTCDIDPIYCELTIRRLELLRQTGRAGWQNANPFGRNGCAASLGEAGFVSEDSQADFGF